MPSLQLFTNNATGKLAVALPIDGTALELQTGEGALFPAPGVDQFCYLTLVDSEQYIEIVKCTARTGDVLTVERGQEGTVSRVFEIGDVCELRITAGSLGRLAQLDAPSIVTGDWSFSLSPAVPLVPASTAAATSRHYVDGQISTHDHAGRTLGPVTLREGSTAATPAAGDSSGAIATTEFVQGALADALRYAERTQEVLAPSDSTDWVTYLTYEIDVPTDGTVVRHDIEADLESRTRFALCQGVQAQLLRGETVIWDRTVECTSEYVEGVGTTYDGRRVVVADTVLDAVGDAGTFAYTLRFRRTRVDEPHEIYQPRIHSFRDFLALYTPV